LALALKFALRENETKMQKCKDIEFFENARNRNKKQEKDPFFVMYRIP
jgi:hypothetical protein